MKKERKRKPFTSARNKKYWIDLGYDEEDAIKLARSRMPGTLEYYMILKNLPEEAAREKVIEWKNSNSYTLENMIRKYGEVEGTERWNSYREKQAYSNSFEYKQEKYGWTEDDFNEYNKSRAITLENLIKKYGKEEGTIKFENYRERQRYAGCSIEYFIERYGAIEGKKRYDHINFMKSHSYESYLYRYDGDHEQAINAYNSYKSRQRVPYSEIATELFDRIYEYMSNNTNFRKIFYVNNIGEWYIWDKNKKQCYFVDFFLKETGRIIEFYGDYWHANPRNYNPSDIVNYPGNFSKIASDIWENDTYRTSILKKHPDVKEVKIIWECDYRENKEEIIKSCIEYLIG